MEQYQVFDQGKVPHLDVIRHKMFNPWFEFTDGRSLYGKLIYSGIFMPSISIETADGAWSLENRLFAARGLKITNTSTGMLVGTLNFSQLTGKITCLLANGTQLNLIIKNSPLKILQWSSEEYGDPISIDIQSFKKNKGSINFTQEAKSQDVPLLLLAMVGTHIALLKRTYQLAAHYG